MYRVLQVVTDMNRGGLESMIMNYYRNIDRNMIQFDFLTHRPYDGDFGEEIKKLGGTIYHLPKLNPFSPNYKKKLKQFFAEHKEYKVIHVHQDCMSSVILKAAKEAGVPIRIAHSHNANQDHNIKYPIKLYYRKLIPAYATMLFACGKEAGDWMYRGSSYKVLNNAIDSEIYRYSYSTRELIRKKYNIKENELLIGHVGQFRPQKNHKYLLDIFMNIQKVNENTRLILVGDDRVEAAESLKRILQKAGLSEKVIFTGLRSDVADILQAMDIFLFPSLYEGLPVTMIEAQASGLPCVISDRVPEECIITDLVDRLSLDQSPEKWADFIVAMFENYARERRDTTADIKNAGFDITTNTMFLQNLYKNFYEGL